MVKDAMESVYMCLTLCSVLSAGMVVDLGMAYVVLKSPELTLTGREDTMCVCKYPYILNNYTGEHEKLVTKFGDSKLHAHGVNKAEISCQSSIPPYRQ